MARGQTCTESSQSTPTIPLGVESRTREDGTTGTTHPVARKHVQGVINQALLAHEPCCQEADRSRSEPDKQAGTDTNEPAIMRKACTMLKL